MSYTPTDQPSSPDKPGSDDGPKPAVDHPRLVEEHHVVGPHGEDQIEATDERGRRWYHLRPEPRGRYDLIGFNYTWWLLWILFIFIIFAPWGRGWGY